MKFKFDYPTKYAHRDGPKWIWSFGLSLGFGNTLGYKSFFIWIGPFGLTVSGNAPKGSESWGFQESP